jgi:hypothetical protein
MLGLRMLGEGTAVRVHAKHMNHEVYIEAGFRTVLHAIMGVSRLASWSGPPRLAPCPRGQVQFPGNTFNYGLAKDLLWSKSMLASADAALDRDAPISEPPLSVYVPSIASHPGLSEWLS